MSSTRLTGSQAPTAQAAPACERNVAESCCGCVALGGLEPFEWQRLVLSLFLGLRTDADGDEAWAAPTCGLSVPRQNGKSLGVVAARAAYGMIVRGEKVVYTSHLQKTSTETFEELRDFFDHPKVRKRVAKVQSALGRECIRLRNGGRITFLARTRNGGRGQHGDLLIFDEAQELDEDQQASFLPAISASRNPQTLYTGTPPDEGAAGMVFSRIRADALSGRSKTTAWAEWSVPKLPDDPSDRALWAAANPSLGITIRESTIAGELEQMGRERFARERLGWWSEQRAEAVMKRADWDACRVAADREPAEGELVAYGVKFSPDGATVALVACAMPPEGAPFVEGVAQRGMADGVSWLADWLAERWRGCCHIAVDGKAGSAALAEMLRQRKVPSKCVDVLRADQAVEACSLFANAVKERALAHAGQPSLAESVAGCSRRRIGSSGGWGFGPIGDSDPTLAEAAAAALWGASHPARNPNRKLRIA